MLIKVALKTGQALGIGKGKSSWSTVHVQDLAEGYILILVSRLALPHPPLLTPELQEHLVKAKNSGEPSWNPYFFASAADFAWGELYQAIATAGSQQGLLKTPDVKFDADEQLAEAVGFPVEAVRSMFGANSINRPDRLKKLGYKPQAAKGNEARPDLIGSIKADVVKVAGELGLTSKA